MGSAWKGRCPKCDRWIRVTWMKTRSGNTPYLVQHGPRTAPCAGSGGYPNKVEHAG